MNPPKKSPGRPKKEEGKRTKKVDVRLSPDELNLLDKMVETFGVGRGELIRLRVFNGAKTMVINSSVLVKSLDAISAEFGRAGNNINQLARYSNILRNQNLLSPAITNHYLHLLEDYTRKQIAMETLLRKIIRSMSRSA